jgi:hypothetical protein
MIVISIYDISALIPIRIGLGGEAFAGTTDW